MKNLKNFNDEQIISKEQMQLFRGSDGKTIYNDIDGRSGTDTYTDDNGDNKLSSGDTVTLDTGKQVCP